MSTLVLAACSDPSSTATNEASDSANNDSGSDSAASLSESVDQSTLDVNIITVSDGSETTLGDLIDGDKPLLIWSWAPWCSNCLRDAPIVEQFAKDNPDVQVIGIGSRGELDAAKEFVESTGVVTSAMVLSESPEDLWEPLGFSGRTENLVISADFQIRSEAKSGFNAAIVEELVASL